MSTSTPSTSNTRHHSVLDSRRNIMFFFKKFIPIIALSAIILGCSAFAPRASVQRYAEDTGSSNHNEASTLASALIQPATATPTVAQLLSAQITSAPAIEKSTTAKNSNILFARVIVENPDSTPPPSPTPAPAATNTPTPTPIIMEVISSTVINAPVVTPAVSLQKGIQHVVVISVDGLRPDALDLTDTPNIDSLRAKGSYCPHAQTVLPSKTLPSHASMLTGMTPDKHGIQWSMPYIGWPGMSGPTLFNVAHDAGFTTGMVFGKEKLNYTVLGDSVDHLFGEDVHDMEVKDKAVEFIQEGLPHILFVHFPDTDRVGHEFGWMSQNQFYSITFVDSMIGEIVTALEDEGYLNNTLLIVTADHGGHGKGHGDDSPLDRTIPWLAVGPDVPSGVTLNTHINTYDTAATVLYAFNLPLPENWDGKPVLEIFPTEFVAATN